MLLKQLNGRANGCLQIIRNCLMLIPIKGSSYDGWKFKYFNLRLIKYDFMMLYKKNAKTTGEWKAEGG